MRILIACGKIPSLEPRPETFSGAGRRAMRLARQFARMGHEVMVLTGTADPIPDDLVEIRSVQDSPSWRGHVEGKPMTRSQTLYGKVSFCRKLLRGWQPDVVYTLSMGVLSIHLILAGRRAGIPVLLGTTLLGSDDLLSLRRRRMGPLPSAVAGKVYSNLAKMSAGVVNLSPAMHEAALKAGYPEERLYLIPNPVDTGVFTPPTHEEKRILRVELGLPKDASIFVSIGAIIPRKGILELVEGFANASVDAKDTVLVLVGPYSETDGYVGKIRDIMKLHDICDRIIMTGEVEAPAPWLRAADVFAFNSSAEGFGTVLVEAMSTGLPIVTKPIPGVTRYIMGDCASVEYVEDDSKWARIFRMPIRSDGYKNRRIASDRFSLEVVSDEYIDVFDKLKLS